MAQFAPMAQIHSRLRNYRIILGLKTFTSHPNAYKYPKSYHLPAHEGTLPTLQFCPQQSPWHQIILNPFWSTLHKLIRDSDSQADIWLGHLAFQPRLSFFVHLAFQCPRNNLLFRASQPPSKPLTLGRTQITGISCLIFRFNFKQKFWGFYETLLVPLWSVFQLFHFLVLFTNLFQSSHWAHCIVYSVMSKSSLWPHGL